MNASVFDGDTLDVANWEPLVHTPEQIIAGDPGSLMLRVLDRSTEEGVVIGYVHYQPCEICVAPRQEEMVIVVKGRATLETAGADGRRERRVLGPGSIAHFPPQVEQRWTFHEPTRLAFHALTGGRMTDVVARSIGESNPAATTNRREL
ncbi:cupin domain-containing protein [Dietzia lutea]|uniref:(S)-ureidoglycine aminohydrolase cupin domain-containing protein n=1 Tax=Dietzia lutea TaxID=546160 RepID=A0A2S1RCQ3_9ACTN|nr:cupin domain-containing protein [Dietzia lutea]AWH94086.1 hypothetical protein A6035_17150 [Dietzia lutea]